MQQLPYPPSLFGEILSHFFVLIMLARRFTKPMLLILRLCSLNINFWVLMIFLGLFGGARYGLYWKNQSPPFSLMMDPLISF